MRPYDGLDFIFLAVYLEALWRTTRFPRETRRQWYCRTREV